MVDSLTSKVAGFLWINFWHKLILVDSLTSKVASCTNLKVWLAIFSYWFILKMFICISSILKLANSVHIVGTNWNNHNVQWNFRFLLSQVFLNLSVIFLSFIGQLRVTGSFRKIATNFGKSKMLNLLMTSNASINSKMQSLSILMTFISLLSFLQT